MTERENLELFHNGSHATAYNYFGCHKCGGDSYVFRVWAPHAVSVSVVGDFNEWNNDSAQMRRLSDGESFEVILKASEGDRYAFVIST